MTLEFPKKRVFFFHYNKPQTQRDGRVRMSVHVANTCYYTDAVRCDVTCQSKENKTQPRLVMKGSCNKLVIEDGLIIIS
jgi:hypothetical protein